MRPRLLEISYRPVVRVSAGSGPPFLLFDLRRASTGAILLDLGLSDSDKLLHKAAVPDLKSEISNLRSQISNLRSKISNLKSKLSRLSHPPTHQIFFIDR